MGPTLFPNLKQVFSCGEKQVTKMQKYKNTNLEECPPMELMVVGVSKVPSASLQNRKCVPRKNEELTFREDFRKLEKKKLFVKVFIMKKEVSPWFAVLKEVPVEVTVPSNTEYEIRVLI